jgi:hypothetical protein
MESKDEVIVKNWLDECRTEATRKLYLHNIKLFLEWYGKPLSVFLALEPMELRHECLKFQNQAQTIKKRTKKGQPTDEQLSRNSIVSVLTALGSLCRARGKTLDLRGKRFKTEIDLTSHTFTNGDLGKMFDVANVEGKALLATMASLGWEVGSVIALSRDFIEKHIAQADAEGKQYAYFMNQRQKTGALRLAVLNPLAIKWLKNWLAQNTNTRLFPDYTTKEGVNLLLKRLAKTANLAIAGRVHSHLIRKWVMSGLSRAGMNLYQIHFLIGKQIPISDSTYLQTLREEIETKYPLAYEHGLNIQPEKVVQVIDQKMTARLVTLEKENEDLKTKMQERGDLKELLLSPEGQSIIFDLMKKYNLSQTKPKKE